MNCTHPRSGSFDEGGVPLGRLISLLKGGIFKGNLRLLNLGLIAYISPTSNLIFPCRINGLSYFCPSQSHNSFFLLISSFADVQNVTNVWAFGRVSRQQSVAQLTTDYMYMCHYSSFPNMYFTAS